MHKTMQRSMMPSSLPVQSTHRITCTCLSNARNIHPPQRLRQAQMPSVRTRAVLGQTRQDTDSTPRCASTGQPKYAFRTTMGFTTRPTTYANVNAELQGKCTGMLTLSDGAERPNAHAECHPTTHLLHCRTALPSTHHSAPSAALAKPSSRL